MSFYQEEKNPYLQSNTYESSSLHVLSLREVSAGLLLFPVECRGLLCCRDLCRASCVSLEKVHGRISSPLRLVTVKQPFALAAGFSLTVRVLLPLYGCPTLHSRTFSVLSRFICSRGETFLSLLDPKGQEPVQWEQGAFLLLLSLGLRK